MNNERFKAFAEDFFNAEIKKERTILNDNNETCIYYYELNDGTKFIITEPYNCEKRGV